MCHISHNVHRTTSLVTSIRPLRSLCLMTSSLTSPPQHPTRRHAPLFLSQCVTPMENVCSNSFLIFFSEFFSFLLVNISLFKKGWNTVRRCFIFMTKKGLFATQRAFFVPPLCLFEIFRNKNVTTPVLSSLFLQ